MTVLNASTGVARQLKDLMSKETGEKIDNAYLADMVNEWMVETIDNKMGW